MSVLVMVHSGVVLVGLVCICWMAFLCLQVLAERWVVTNIIAGMIVGEIVCMAATTVFAVTPMVRMSNEFSIWTAVALWLAIYAAPTYFTGQLVFYQRLLHSERQAALRGSEVLAKQMQVVDRHICRMRSLANEGCVGSNMAVHQEGVRQDPARDS